MGQVWMRPAVSGSLGEGQVLLFIQIVNAFGCEHLDWLRQQVGVIRHLDALGARGCYHHVPNGEVWVKQSASSQGLVPTRILETITNWMIERL